MAVSASKDLFCASCLFALRGDSSGQRSESLGLPMSCQWLVLRGETSTVVCLVRPRAKGFAGLFRGDFWGHCPQKWGLI